MIRPRYQGDAFVYVCELITHQMYPFRPGEITVHTFGDSDGNMSARVEISTLPNDHYTLTDSRVFKTMDSGYIACELGMRASKFFNSLPAPPVGDNVILGSN